MIWNWKWKKMLFSISSKYSYFKPILNYIKKRFWKGILIFRNCDTLMCFCPKLHVVSPNLITPSTKSCKFIFNASLICLELNGVLQSNQWNQNQLESKFAKCKEDGMSNNLIKQGYMCVPYGNNDQDVASWRDIIMDSHWFSKPMSFVRFFISSSSS
jgi:hypothetical protein